MSIIAEEPFWPEVSGERLFFADNPLRPNIVQVRDVVGEEVARRGSGEGCAPVQLASRRTFILHEVVSSVDHPHVWRQMEPLRKVVQVPFSCRRPRRLWNPGSLWTCEHRGGKMENARTQTRVIIVTGRVVFPENLCKSSWNPIQTNPFTQNLPTHLLHPKS